MVVANIQTARVLSGTRNLHYIDLLLNSAYDFVCSNPYRAWEVVVLFALVSNCLISTFKAAFDSAPVSAWIVAYICDLICIINVILSFYVTYIDRRGIYVTSCQTITRTYFRKMFFWDFLSILPTDIIVLFPGFPDVYRKWRFVAKLRTNRLLGLHRVFRFTGI